MQSLLFKDLIPKIETKETEEDKPLLLETFNYSPAFLDFDMKMNMNPFTNDLALKSLENAVSQSLKNLLLNKKFFTIMPINFRKLIFENDNVPFMISNIKSKIETHLSRYEPRAKIEDVEIIKDLKNKTLTINISFYIVTNPDVFYKFPIFVNLRV